MIVLSSPSLHCLLCFAQPRYSTYFASPCFGYGPPTTTIISMLRFSVLNVLQLIPFTYNKSTVKSWIRWRKEAYLLNRLIVSRANLFWFGIFYTIMRSPEQNFVNCGFSLKLQQIINSITIKQLRNGYVYYRIFIVIIIVSLPPPLKKIINVFCWDFIKAKWMEMMIYSKGRQPVCSMRFLSVPRHFSLIFRWWNYETGSR